MRTYLLGCYDSSYSLRKYPEKTNSLILVLPAVAGTCLLTPFSHRWMQTVREGGWLSLAGGVVLSVLLRCAESEAVFHGASVAARRLGVY